MKKIILSIILFSLVTNVFSQSRVNRSKLSFSNSSEKLSSSTGWSYNETLGEWIDYENVINKDKVYKTKYKSLRGEYMMSRIKQNFIDIKTKSLSINEEKYFVVMVRKWDGRYKYPSIYEDWYSWEEVQGFIFTENEYSKILNFTGEIKLETNNYVELGSSYEKYDETVFLDLIQNELKSDNKYSSKYTFPVLKTTSDELEVIRFYVPQVFTKSKFNSYNFEKEYLETSPENFDKIIIR
jgi:hypothetical protein